MAQSFLAFSYQQSANDGESLMTINPTGNVKSWASPQYHPPRPDGPHLRSGGAPLQSQYVNDFFGLP